MGTAVRHVTTLTLAVIITIAQVGAASAFDLTFGSRVRTNFGYTVDSHLRTENGDEGATRGFFSVLGSSYFRATFTSDDKKVGVRAEMGLASSAMTRRHVFGWYRIGSFKIVAGNTESDVDLLYAPNQHMGTTDLQGWGMVKALRQPIISLNWKSGGMAAQLAIRDHRENLVPVNMSTTGVDVYWTAPTVAGAFRYSHKYFTVNPSFQWAMTQYEGQPDNTDGSAQSWVVKLPVKLMYGPVSIIADIHYGHNLAGEFVDQPDFALPVVKSNGMIENTLSYGGFASAQFKQERWSLTTGVGYEKYDNDAWRETLGYAQDEFHRVAWYMTLALHLHSNLTFFPEVMYQKTGEDPVTGESMGSRWYVGMQIRFLF